ncbi:MAG: serpin family protein [Candidatus Eremiobacteraeota bacterium]|nr:serpin family protein [Candidatus Eremiobacteraeota bacterium]
MKRTTIFITLMIIIGLLISGTAYPARKPGMSDDMKTLVKGNNDFGFDIYRKLCAGSKQNLFLSPYSISTALGMTYAGAKGNTQKQMSKVLHYDLPQKRLHKSFSDIMKSLDEGGKRRGYQLNVANRLWGQKGYKFLDSFLNVIKTYYDGGLQIVDFKRATEKARVTINTWVEKETNGKIKDLLSKGILTSDTRLVLTNAIYFKDEWLSRFDPEMTQKETFKLADGKSIKTDMMHQSSYFKYNNADGVQILEMPYRGRDISMVILLPDKVNGIYQLEKKLNSGNMDKWIKGMRHQKVGVIMPKFKLDSSFSLGDTLKKMGMSQAFSSKADFSGMTGKKDLFISAVIHKTYVSIYEAGTEAAAATAVVMTKSAAGPSKKPKLFRADHPFVFVIRDKRTGSVLFIGRLMKP